MAGSVRGRTEKNLETLERGGGGGMRGKLQKGSRKYLDENGVVFGGLPLPLPHLRPRRRFQIKHSLAGIKFFQSSSSNFYLEQASSSSSKRGTTRKLF